MDGQDAVTGLPITMERCFVRNWGEFSTYEEISCDFLPSDIILGRDKLTKTLLSTIKFYFDLTNVFRIRRINSLISGPKIMIKKNDRTAW
ncbi:MAG: hypothetical protein WBF33_15765 [Candidatus Nitrosopolaris sp.]